MFRAEQFDLTLNSDLGWNSIECSWEFTNPTRDKEYACQVAKTLALQCDRDAHLRVVSEPIAPGTQVPTLSELNKGESQ